MSAAVEAPAHVRRIPGEAGTWVFLFGDMVVFQIFFSTFLHARGKAPGLFDQSRRTLELGIGIANTVVLLTSSLLVATAMTALRRDARDPARRLVLGAASLGLVFVGLKAVEYTLAVRAGHPLSTNTFFLYYFILTGLHLFHVTIGIGALLFVSTQTRRVKPGTTRMAVVEGAGCFWHMVDLLWIFLFPLLYLVS